MRNQKVVGPPLTRTIHPSQKKKILPPSSTPAIHQPMAHPKPSPNTPSPMLTNPQNHTSHTQTIKKQPSPPQKGPRFNEIFTPTHRLISILQIPHFPLRHKRIPHPLQAAIPVPPLPLLIRKLAFEHLYDVFADYGEEFPALGADVSVNRLVRIGLGICG